MANPAVQTFGKYQILERIATGGMAEIYKARLEGIGGFQRTFAIKRILPNLSQNSEYIAMLVDEAKVAGLLSHANIIQILDLGQVDGIWYIAMEYVAGRDLGAVLRRARKKGLCLPVPHTVFIAIELLKGLEYAHQRQVMRGGRPVALNIIHRDVSPPNVLLSFQGEVKLTDFGIARASLKAMETVSGIVKGRFDYMSPEQAAGSKDLDQRSDLFSVGVVLYEMLTGHHPFRTDNEIGTIERVRTGKYVPVSQRNPEVPFTLETIVDRALQVNRDDRYPSATAFKEALDKFFHDAGFIFTHATLASYVKGLFPEASSRPGKTTHTPPSGVTATGKGPPPNRTGTPIPADTSEGPTRRLDRRKLEARPPGEGPTSERVPTPTTGPTRIPDSQSPTSGAAVTPGPPPLDSATLTRPGPPPLSDLLGDDQETLIRKAPAGWEEEVATQIRSVAQAGLDVPDLTPDPETVLRPQRFADEPKAELSATGQRRSDGKGARPAEAATRRARKSGGGGVVTWALAAVSLFFGICIGGVAILLAVAVGFQFGPTRGSGPLPDPQLQVVAPTGTQILVDGDAMGPQMSLSPDQEHVVTVTLQGQEPWTTKLVLHPGDIRVLTITAVPIAPAPAPEREKKAPGR